MAVMVVTLSPHSKNIPSSNPSRGLYMFPLFLGILQLQSKDVLLWIGHTCERRYIIIKIKWNIKNSKERQKLTWTEL